MTVIYAYIHARVTIRSSGMCFFLSSHLFQARCLSHETSQDMFGPCGRYCSEQEGDFIEVRHETHIDDIDMIYFLSMNSVI